MQDVGGSQQSWGGSLPHLEGGDDPLASVLEEILIGPGRMLLGQCCGQVVVVPKPGNALSLQEGVLIPPGTPQVCKSHHHHQWGNVTTGSSFAHGWRSTPSPVDPAQCPLVPSPFLPPQANQQPGQVRSSTGPPARTKCWAGEGFKGSWVGLYQQQPFPPKKFTWDQSWSLTLLPGHVASSVLAGMPSLVLNPSSPLGNCLLSHSSPDPYVLPPCLFCSFPFPGVHSVFSSRDLLLPLLSVRDEKLLECHHYRRSLGDLPVPWMDPVPSTWELSHLSALGGSCWGLMPAVPPGSSSGHRSRSVRGRRWSYHPASQSSCWSRAGTRKRH